MASELPKGLSTKAPQHVPVEFENVFVEEGWPRANYLFGKRATTRYFMYLGPERLRAARAAFVRAQTLARELEAKSKRMQPRQRR